MRYRIRSTLPGYAVVSRFRYLPVVRCPNEVSIPPQSDTEGVSGRVPNPCSLEGLFLWSDPMERAITWVTCPIRPCSGPLVGMLTGRNHTRKVLNAISPIRGVFLHYAMV